MKRKTESVQLQHFSAMKKVRSKLPHRRRSPISPILFVSDPTASSHLTTEPSCDSSLTSVKPKSSLKKRGSSEISTGEDVRRITRSNNKLRATERSEKVADKRIEEEISESSCVESCSGAVYGKRGSKSKSRIGKQAENVKKVDGIGETSSVVQFSEKKLKLGADTAPEQDHSKQIRTNKATSAVSDSESSLQATNYEIKKTIEGFEDSESFARSENSTVRQYSRKFPKSVGEKVKRTESSLKLPENKVVSLDFSSKLPCETKLESICSEIGKSSPKSIRDSENKMSKNEGTSKFSISNSESTTEKVRKLISADFDLACRESLESDEVSEYYSSDTLDSFEDSSDQYFTDDYSPSMWYESYDSGSQLSERSHGDKSPSPTFNFFLLYGRQFCKSVSALDCKVRSRSPHETSDQFNILRFEDEEEEESYQVTRERERRGVYLHDYAEEYCSSTDYGELVIQQRLQMVHWIVEQSSTKELQKETMFLGVSLLDRFLSRGYFKNKRNLQISGIACLTLAIRIEENQPNNCVRQKTFWVGSNVYSSREVVAMEWLVQETLDFQCFLPTIYNFLWYYLKAAGATPEVEKTSKYLSVLALLGHEHLCFWPSTVAAGLVILASAAANQEAACLRVTEVHSRTLDDFDLPDCIKSLGWLARYI